MSTNDAGPADEAGGGSGLASAGPAPRHAKIRRLRWRAWRRSRPFWGGVLLILAGLELLAIPLSGVLVHGMIKLVIYIGIGGVFGVLIGVLMIAAAIMLWADPAHRVFYGIVGMALGLASFPASNLGGFFLGMLLAIIGGALGYAWTPMAQAPLPAVAEGPAPGVEPVSGIDLLTGGGGADGGEEPAAERVPDPVPEHESGATALAGQEAHR